MFIVSFVNQLLSPHLRLGVFDENFENFEYLDSKVSLDSSGATGIDFSIEQNLSYVAFQNSQIAVFDRNFELLQLFCDSKIKDPHSVLVSNGSLFVVASGCDSVYSITINESGLLYGDPTLVWRYPGSNGSSDTVHVNSIFESDGQKFVTFFGERVSTSKRQESNLGKVVSIDHDEIVCGLNNPHSLFHLNGKLCVLNSYEGEVRDNGNQLLYKTRGYLRGAQVVGGLLYLGVNKRRLLSKHNSHVFRGRIEEFESDIVQSEIEVVQISNWKCIRRIPFEIYGREIYDLKKVPFDLAPKFSEKPEVLRLKCIENEFVALIKESEERRVTEIKSCEQQVNAIRERNLALENIVERDAQEFEARAKEILELEAKVVDSERLKLKVEGLNQQLDFREKSNQILQDRYSFASITNAENEKQLVVRTSLLNEILCENKELKNEVSVLKKENSLFKGKLREIYASRILKVAFGVQQIARKILGRTRAEAICHSNRERQDHFVSSEEQMELPILICSGKHKYIGIPEYQLPNAEDCEWYKIDVKLRSYNNSQYFKKFSDLSPPMPLLVGSIGVYDDGKQIKIIAATEEAPIEIVSFEKKLNWIDLRVEHYLAKETVLVYLKETLISEGLVRNPVFKRQSLLLGCGYSSRFWRGEFQSVLLKSHHVSGAEKLLSCKSCDDVRLCFDVT